MTIAGNTWVHQARFQVHCAAQQIPVETRAEGYRTPCVIFRRASLPLTHLPLGGWAERCRPFFRVRRLSRPHCTRLGEADARLITIGELHACCLERKLLAHQSYALSILLPAQT